MSGPAVTRRGASVRLATRAGRASPPSSRAPAALALLAALAVAGVTATTGAQAAGGAELTPLDRELPAFELPALDGETYDAAALDGRPWIVNFWATWCAPCVHELPAMNAARASLEGDGVGMLAINAGETREDIEAFLEKVPIDFPVLLGDAVATLPDWSVEVLPTTLVIDADGRVVYEALGPRAWDDEALLDRVRALR